MWEIAVKIQMGHLDLLLESVFYLRHLLTLKAQVLDVGLRHTLGVLGLPLLHKDPFDRLLRDPMVVAPLRQATDSTNPTGS